METIADRINRLAETAKASRSAQSAAHGSTQTSSTDLQAIETELASFHVLTDPVLTKMRHIAARYIRSVRESRPPCWLTLWGANGRGNGTGKTHLARLIAECVRMHLPATPPTCFLSWPTICTRKQSGGDVTHKLGFAREAGLLVIDDAGANLSPAQWSDRDHRISSRLHRHGSYLLQCETADWSERNEKPTEQ